MDANIIVAIITGLFGLATIVLTWCLSRKPKEKRITTPKLEGHHIFTRLDTLKNHIDVNFTLPNKGKEILFKDMLITNLNVWNTNLRALAIELDNKCDQMDSVEFQNTILGHFEKGLQEFASYYRTQNYTHEEQIGLDLVMAKFNKWNYPRVNSFRETLMIVCTSQFYLDHRIKSAVILDMYISFFVDTISDAESTIGEINGDLRGIVFRGVTI